MSGLTRSSGLARTNAVITKRTRSKMLSPLNVTPEGLKPPATQELSGPPAAAVDTGALDSAPEASAASAILASAASISEASASTTAAVLTAKDLEPYMTWTMAEEESGDGGIPESGGGMHGSVAALQHKLPAPIDLRKELFEVIARLGEGSSGTVFKVKHILTGQLMAKKTISTAPNTEVQKQIIRELSFLRTCHSPNIVSFYGATLEDADTSICIYMEYVDAGSLDSIYKRVRDHGGCIGEGVLGKVAEAVLRGLTYLHGRHIIHRDIKPSNILISRRGEIKLCDFGVSGELVDSIANTFVGTSYYMAPERIQGNGYAVQSDIWSLGLTLVEVAQNRFPFPPPGHAPLTIIELLQYIIMMPIPGLKVEDGWSPELCDFVAGCLTKDAKQRPSLQQMCRHPFILRSAVTDINLEEWISEVVAL